MNFNCLNLLSYHLYLLNSGSCLSTTWVFSLHSSLWSYFKAVDLGKPASQRLPSLFPDVWLLGYYLSIYFVCNYSLFSKLWKILKEMGMPGHLVCFLRNLYTGQEATVRAGHGIPDWFQIGKGVLQGCILSPCLFNLYAEYVMRNARLDEAQAGIKIAGRNINNLREADATTLMAES